MCVVCFGELLSDRGICLYVVSFRQLCCKLRIIGVHAVLTWHLRGVRKVGNLHELRGGLLLGSDRGDLVFELRGRVVSPDHGRDNVIELRSVWRR